MVCVIHLFDRRDLKPWIMDVDFQLRTTFPRGYPAHNYRAVSQYQMNSCVNSHPISLSFSTQQ